MYSNRLHFKSFLLGTLFDAIFCTQIQYQKGSTVHDRIRLKHSEKWSLKKGKCQVLAQLIKKISKKNKAFKTFFGP